MKTKYSEILKQQITITGSGITTDDGQNYSKEELSLIDGCGPERKRGFHQVKKLFMGEIVDVRL